MLFSGPIGATSVGNGALAAILHLQGNGLFTDNALRSWFVGGVRGANCLVLAVRNSFVRVVDQLIDKLLGLVAPMVLARRFSGIASTDHHLFSASFVERAIQYRFFEDRFRRTPLGLSSV